MSIDNVTGNLSARHCVRLFSADLESPLQLLTGVLAFLPQNMDFV